jgi:hypothetical protein
MVANVYLPVVSKPIRHSMQSTNPKNILGVLHLVRAGLASGLLTKEEVIEWADEIITKDEQPDIFFIDLALSTSKSKNDIIHYFSDYLNFENPAVPGRPLLGLLYKQYNAGQRNLEQTVRTLFRLKSETILTDGEKDFVYSIDNDFDLAQDNVYGSIEDVRKETERFLEIYKDCSIDNIEQWQQLDKQVDQIFEAERKKQLKEFERLHSPAIATRKAWWNFW